MKKKSEKQLEREEQERIEFERKEDMFDKARMYKMLEFITACMIFRQKVYELSSTLLEFKITLLEDGEYEICQETFDSRDYKHSPKPCIISDCNSIIYDKMMELLLDETFTVQCKLDEIKRIKNLRQSALLKLTPDEKKVLGL